MNSYSNYKNLRKQLLNELRKNGAKSPSRFYPILKVESDHLEDQIDRMRSHVISLVEVAENRK